MVLNKALLQRLDLSLREQARLYGLNFHYLR